MAKEHKTDVSRKPGNGPQARGTRPLMPFDDLERWFEGAFPGSWPRPTTWPWPRWSVMQEPFEGKMPRVDVIDREQEIVVRAEVPGIEKKDLDVSLTDNTVTIKGRTRQESKEEKGDYYRCEISQGSFSRTVALPADVDSNKARATFRNGLLELVLPKRETAKRHSIKVE